MLIVEIVLLMYFIYVVLYTAVFAFGGLFYKTPTPAFQGKNLRFCVLIPSYKEDAVILDGAKKESAPDVSKGTL